MVTVNVTADVTAIVHSIDKIAGDDVARGDVIMILESMKMEIPVKAPESGRLSEVLVAEGDSVEEEEIVCRIET